MEGEMAAEGVMTYIGATAIITPLGEGASEHFEKMLKGETAIGRRTIIDRTSICGESVNDDILLEEHQAKMLNQGELSRIEQYMLRVTLSVVPREGLAGRTLVIISTTKGDINRLAISNPLAFEAYKKAISLGVSGADQYQYMTVSNACISGVAVVVVADRYIRSGMYDNVILVGADEYTHFTLTGFKAFKSIATEVCRPFDKYRDGLMLGEGFGAMLLTSEKRLSSGYVVSGGAMTNDANHISGPSRTGEPLAEAIQEAMTHAGLSAKELSFVNAHGTGTLYNDEMESKALSLCGMSDTPLNSLKPYLGHTLGASGVIETVMSIEEHRRGVLLGTLGYSEQGTPYKVGVTAEKTSVSGKAFLKTASGFGGCNAAVVISNDSSHVQRETSEVRYSTEANVSIKNNTIYYNGEEYYHSEGDFSTFIRAAYRHIGDTNMKFFKMSDLCKLGYIGAEVLMKEIGKRASTDPRRVAMVMTNDSSSHETDMQHRELIDVGEMASPAIFVYTLPNIIIGEISIRHKITGEGLFMIGATREEVRRYAEIVLREERYERVLTGKCEKAGDKYELEFEMIKREEA